MSVFFWRGFKEIGGREGGGRMGKWKKRKELQNRCLIKWKLKEICKRKQWNMQQKEEGILCEKWWVVKQIKEKERKLWVEKEKLGNGFHWC